MKYIDADKLIAEIKFAKSVYSNPNRVMHGIADGFRQDGRAAMCDDILTKITSLQQERGPHTESWLEETKKELQHEEELLDMRLETLKRIRDKKNQFQQEQPLTTEKVVEQCKKFGGNPEVIQQERPEVEIKKEIENEWRKQEAKRPER